MKNEYKFVYQTKTNKKAYVYLPTKDYVGSVTFGVNEGSESGIRIYVT